MHNDYELLDSGDARKLERFGDVILSRPCAQALWPKDWPESWTTAAASFDRERGWQRADGFELPSAWIVMINGLQMTITPTPAGHLGVFPETRLLWDRITEALDAPLARSADVLNLFAYSGGATLAAARAGCSVCHVDSSKSMVTRARGNAALNQLDTAPIRWIVEDVGKFLDREIRRGRAYDAIMLDPPSFGRGTRGEQYKSDRDLAGTLAQCEKLLSDAPLFVLLTSHTQGVTSLQLESLMRSSLGAGDMASGEMELTGGPDVRPVVDGVWVEWKPARGR